MNATFDAQTLVLFLLAQVGTAAGVYAAIRADLREALVRISLLERRFEHGDMAFATTKGGRV